MSEWIDFWDWLHCKAEELDVWEISGPPDGWKRFDVQVWLCEMEDKWDARTLEETVSD